MRHDRSPRRVPVVRCRQLVFHFGETLFELLVGDGLGSASCVEGDGFCCGAGKSCDKGRDTIWLFVGQMLAFVGDFGCCQVDGVRLSASAHCDVDPFSVDAVADDGVSASGGSPLGLVHGDGVAPVNETPSRVVPTRNPPSGRAVCSLGLRPVASQRVRLCIPWFPGR